MRASRLVLLLIVAAAGLYVVKNYSGLFGSRPQDVAPGPASPIERARAARDQSDRKTAQTESTSREADTAPAAGVTENMTPDQVRALLGPPRRDRDGHRGQPSDAGDVVLPEGGKIRGLRERSRDLGALNP